MSGEQVAGKRDKPKPAARRIVRGQYSLLEAPVPDDDPESAYKEVAELLTQQFTSDQLGMLRDMLDKMAAGPGSMDKSLGEEREKERK